MTTKMKIISLSDIANHPNMSLPAKDYLGSFYDQISGLIYECNCTEIPLRKWEQLMKNSVRADHKKINKLVKKYLPYLYDNLALNYYNPYNYYRTKTHLILVHSHIEYFLRII
jgi:hypothetical protein